MAEMAATTYGGAEVSWALVELKPIALVMVGRVNLIPDEGTLVNSILRSGNYLGFDDLP